MLSQDESVRALVCLGLTVLQAKVYIALSKLGSSAGRITAKEAEVAPQDVYRILGDLEEKGLAEKIIAKPIMYKATPIKEGISILLRNKKEQYEEAEKLAKKIPDYSHENGNQNILRENTKFIITSKFSLLLKMHDNLADSSKKTIDFMCPEKWSEKTLFDNCKYIKRAIGRGVKIRVVTLKFNGEPIVKNPNPLPENPLFEHRSIPETVYQFGMHIFDEQEVTLAVCEKKPMPSLWTNNPNVVILAENYFENVWNNAQKNTLAQSLLTT